MSSLPTWWRTARWPPDEGCARAPLLRTPARFSAAAGGIQNEAQRIRWRLCRLTDAACPLRVQRSGFVLERRSSAMSELFPPREKRGIWSLRRRGHASPVRDARLRFDSGHKQPGCGPAWFVSLTSLHPRCSRRLGRFSVTPRTLRDGEIASPAPGGPGAAAAAPGLHPALRRYPPAQRLRASSCHASVPSRPGR